eukprot:COSAG06_NODE_5023_length_3783_cov_1.945168_2_plen_203_part_00
MFVFIYKWLKKCRFSHRESLQAWCKGAVDREVAPAWERHPLGHSLRLVPILVVEKLRLPFIVPPERNAVLEKMRRVCRPPRLHLLRSEVNIVRTERVRPRRFLFEQPIEAVIQVVAVCRREAPRLPDAAKLEVVLCVYLCQLLRWVREDLRIIACIKTTISLWSPRFEPVLVKNSIWRQNLALCYAPKSLPFLSGSGQCGGL